MSHHLATRPRRAPLLLTALVLVVLLLVSSTQLRAQTITCHSASGQDCPAEVTSQLHQLKGQSLVFTDLFSTAQSALAAQRTYRVKEVRKQFPQTLVVMLESQTLLYQVKMLGQSELFSVSDTGRLVPAEPHEGLRTIVVPPELWAQWQITGQVDSATQTALQELPSLLVQAQINPEAIVLHDAQTLVLYQPQNQTVLVDVYDVSEDLARLSLIQNQLQQEPLEQPIEEIDLRYDLPVLRPTRNIPRHQAL